MTIDTGCVRTFELGCWTSPLLTVYSLAVWLAYIKHVTAFD
jgi:hypothetical protein